MAKKYYDSMKNDGGEISSVKNEFANMPQEVKHKAYPKGAYGCPGGYRDNREGIDEYAKENYMKIKKQHRSPSDAG